MLKGVSHRIIEVKDTKSPYFEKAILFVKEKYSDEERSRLENEAEITVNFIAGSFHFKKKRGKKIFIISALCGLIASAVVLFFLL